MKYLIFLVLLSSCSNLNVKVPKYYRYYCNGELKGTNPFSGKKAKTVDCVAIPQYEE